jgi:hypothetical protein
MTPDEAPDFFARLMALGELFNAKLSEAAQMLYFDALADLEIADVVCGMTEAAKSCKFMPKPIEIRERATSSVEDDADEQWELLKSNSRSLGAYDREWRDDVSETAVATLYAIFGDWANFCLWDLSHEMWAAKRKEFVRSYVRRRQSEQRELMQARLGERRALKLLEGQ